MLSFARSLPGRFENVANLIINQGFRCSDAGLSRQEREGLTKNPFSLLEDAKRYFTIVYRFLTQASLSGNGLNDLCPIFARLNTRTKKGHSVRGGSFFVFSG